MRITALIFLLVGLLAYARCEEQVNTEEQEEQTSLLNCIFEENTAGCLSKRIARDIDRIEMQVTGKKSETPMSSVLEQAGNFVAEVIDDLQEPEGAEETEDQGENRGMEEARKKKYGKKKKKHLQKLMGLAMLFKAKLSLLLQVVSTHLQLKFFAIAIISLILNATKFWLDLKKSHSPSKVIYYEHAQHQHHYDHDDHEHGGYWGRSSNDSPQDMAYSAYAPEK